MSTATRPLPRPTPISAGFWEAAARRELVLQRCHGCRGWRHYPQPMCPTCHSREWGWERASGRGEIYSFVVAHRAFHALPRSIRRADGRPGNLLTGFTSMLLRLWEAEPADEAKAESQRDYETVGYVISGRAELEIEGQTVLLEPGDSWVVPRGSLHTYRILEDFTAVEATSPPAFAHGRDRAV